MAIEIYETKTCFFWISEFTVFRICHYNEDALQNAIYLAYIYALNCYTVIKEMTTGKGFADGNSQILRPWAE